MIRTRRLAGVLWVLAVLAAALSNTVPAVSAQDPPLHTAALPLVIGAPDNLMPDIAYIVRTRYAGHGNYESAVEYRDWRLSPPGTVGVGLPRWSPDGLRLAFALAIENSGGTTGGLYVADIEGIGRARIIGNGDGRRCLASWAPDGSLLPCVELVGGVWTLALVSPDGDTLARVAVGGQPGELEWSPDGQRIAYLVSAGEQRADLRVVHTDGSGDLLLAQGVYNQGAYAWSPDGQWVAYVALLATDPYHQAELRLVSADGTSDLLLAPAVFAGDYPSWSPDGYGVAYHLSAHAQGVPASGVLVTSFQDANLELDLTLVGCPGNGPVWSPDGRHIAFGADGIQVMRPDGSGRMRVGYGMRWTWSPDGRRLAYEDIVFDLRWTTAEGPVVFVVWVDTPLPQQRLVKRGAYGAAWRPPR